MKQSDTVLHGEGDAWFERNRDNLGKHDPVSAAIREQNIVPKSVLEIGCANGWRLAALRDEYGCDILGIEPSQHAGVDASERRIPVYGATADSLPVRGREFDIVIYGFCLYLTDPVDWFKIVTQGDRVLQEGGYLIIHDFEAPDRPFARRYEHRDGLLAYHVDFAALWLAHPLYSLVTRNAEITVIQKLPASSIEVRP